VLAVFFFTAGVFLVPPVLVSVRGTGLLRLPFLPASVVVFLAVFAAAVGVFYSGIVFGFFLVAVE